MDEFTDNIFTTGEIAYFNEKTTFFAGIQADVTGNVIGDLQGNIFAPDICIFENGPIIIGGLDPTDTPNQLLQVFGGGYFQEDVGIGTTNPKSKLQVLGDIGIGTVIKIVPYDDLNNGTLHFESPTGRQLLSVTNNQISGSLFSINDYYGVPIVDVNANKTIQLSPYGGNIGIGTTNPTAKLEVVGDVSISGFTTISGITTITGSTLFAKQLNVSGVSTFSGTVNATTFVGNGITPLGGIIMWSGTIVEASALEPGWALCDGRIVNGRTTPDLRNRFIVGASTETASGNYLWDATTGLTSGNYGVGNSGGEAAHQLTTTEMSSHRHFTVANTSVVYPFSADEGVVSSYYLSLSYDSGGNGSYFLVGKNTPEPNYYPTSATGGDAYHENRPPYFALAFLMRTA